MSILFSLHKTPVAEEVTSTLTLEEVTFDPWLHPQRALRFFLSVGKDIQYGIGLGSG